MIQRKREVSNAAESGGDERAQYREGLRMLSPPDAEQLATERRQLRELEGLGTVRRLIGYSRLIGPGYLQSAMTLGGGTAATSLFAGALLVFTLKEKLPGNDRIHFWTFLAVVSSYSFLIVLIDLLTIDTR